MADPSRGEIWLVDLGAGHGHEQGGQRPVLVVSDDAFNAGLAGLVMTVPRTISKDQLGKAAWGTVSATTLAEVERALRVLLGL